MKAPTLQELLEAGVHFGHQTRRGNPKMRDYIYGARDGVHIINLELTEKLLKVALDYAEQLGEEGKVLLFVGTKKQAQPIVKKAAEEAGAPYLTARWIGGFLTNFDEIKKNLSKLTALKEARTKGELGRYTKREQLLISRKLEKFDTEMGGVANLALLPDAVFLTDCVAEKTALAEANRMGIKVIGIADTNSNPSLMDYPIPANDDAAKALALIVSAMGQAYKDGLEKGGKKAAAAAKKAQAAEQKAAEATAVPDDQILEAEVMVEKEAIKDASREDIKAKV